MTDPGIQSHKGFGMQVDNAAGVLRWYYDNKDKSFVKKKTFLPALIIRKWFRKAGPQPFFIPTPRTCMATKIFGGFGKPGLAKFIPTVRCYSRPVLPKFGSFKRRPPQICQPHRAITRADPRLVVMVPDIELLTTINLGPEISFPNYSLLKTPATTYLLDYDTLRPFASDEVVRKLGYNPKKLLR